MNYLDLMNIAGSAPNLLPAAYIKCHQIEESELVSALRGKLAGAAKVSPEDAAQCFLALYAWRNVRGVEAYTDGTGQATMRNLSDFAAVFGFADTSDGIDSIVSFAVSEHWVTPDVGPTEAPDRDSDTANYAYLDPGGFEAGVAVVASIVDEREFERKLLVPASGRVVDLTHNQKKVDDAIEKVVAATKAIETSNTLAPEEKQVWIRLLSEGRDRLRRPSTYVAVLSALLLKPLYDAYSSVVEESAKPIIHAAFLAIKALMGL